MSKSFVNVEDVLTDDLFIAWWSRADLQKVNEWENWLKANPGYQPLVDEAVVLMNNLYVSEAPVPEEKIAATLSRLNDSIDKVQETPVVAMPAARSKRRWWIAAAAAVVLIMAASSLLLLKSPQKQSAYFTPYGQLEKHELPDGSVVTLNANSSVKIEKAWSEETDREVWLNGEAFFKVAKTEKRNRFIVHTGQLDVIVTGTQFNVVSRNNKTSVLLTEGSVTILTKDGKEIKMIPGEFVELNNNEPIQKKEVNPENITAWTDRKMVFENTTMEQAAGMIKEIYGAEVKLNDDKARAIVLTGVMPNDNLDVLLQSIEATMDCKITRDGNMITITGK